VAAPVSLLVPQTGHDSMTAPEIRGAHDSLSETIFVSTAANGPPTEADVRRWLSLLERPDRLVDSDLVTLFRARSLLPAELTGLDAARAAARTLVELIERIRPADGAARRQYLPYRVLHLCFVQGMKNVQVAQQLGMSVRQLSRERGAGVRLLQVELEKAAAPVAETRQYRFMPIPAILDYQPRLHVSTGLGRALAEHKLVHVHGPRGIGKTSLVAEFAIEHERVTPVLWYRVRRGVNDTLPSLLFEIAEHLMTRGPTVVAAAIEAGSVDPGVLTRMVIRELAALNLLLVLDDYHIAEGDLAIAGFIDDAANRLDGLRVITISRHSDPPSGSRASIDVPAMTRIETQKLLAQYGVRTTPAMADRIRKWTSGIPQLISFAASWLHIASDEDVARGLEAFAEYDAVQTFLLDSISELVAAAERSVLDAASVFRQQYNDEALAQVAGLTIGAVRDTNRRLIRSHLATRSRSGSVAFFHTSVREYFYSRLEPERRAELHSRAAAWYEGHAQPAEARYHREAAALPSS